MEPEELIATETCLVDIGRWIGIAKNSLCGRTSPVQTQNRPTHLTSMSTIDLSIPANITPSGINTSFLTIGNETIANISEVTPASRSRGGVFIPWDNPENIMTKAVSDDITYSLQCVVFPILTVFGLVGSGLSLIVLLQKKLRKSTTSIILTGLAISDFCFLITNMARKSTCIIRQYDKLAADTFNAKAFPGLFYTKTAFSRVSTLLVVLISVERLVAVAFPLQVRSIVTKPRMIVAVITCFIIPFAFCAALPAQYTYTYIRGRPYIAQTDFALENVDALKIYNEYFLVISLRYIPVILVIILNAATTILFKRSRRFQNKNAMNSERELARQREERKVTRMLLVVALIFLICLLPGDIVLLISGINTKFSFFGTYHNFFLVISDLSLLFEIVNSSLNFIIYMVLNKLFFETYQSLFCRCLTDRRTRNEMSTKGQSKVAVTGTTSAGGSDIKECLKEYGIEVSVNDTNDTKDPNSKQDFDSKNENDFDNKTDNGFDSNKTNGVDGKEQNDTDSKIDKGHATEKDSDSKKDSNRV